VPNEALKDYTEIIRREKKRVKERRGGAKGRNCRNALSILLRNEKRDTEEIYS